MKWSECSGIEQAIQFAMGKTIVPRDRYGPVFPPEHEADVVMFSDKTAIACVSQWSGPYSEETPDTDPEPPKWWIGCPRS